MEEATVATAKTCWNLEQIKKADLESTLLRREPEQCSISRAKDETGWDFDSLA